MLFKKNYWFLFGFLENQFRGLDEDETEFLDKINQRKNELERKRKQEEIDLLKQCFHAEMLATTASTSTTILKPKVDKSNNDSKKVNQKDVVKKLIIKRKSDVPAADLDEVVKKKEKLEEKAPEKSSVKATIENTKTDKKPTLLTGYALVFILFSLLQIIINSL